MATAALTGAPTTTKFDTSVPSGSILNAVIYTVPANTIAIVNLGFNNMVNGDVSIRGVQGGGGSYAAVIATSSTVGFVDTFTISDPNRIIEFFAPTGANGDWNAASIKGASFYMYPGETLCISGNGGPGRGATQYVYALAGS